MHRYRTRRWQCAALAAAALLAASAPAPANETDQFTLPFGATFVDLGDYLGAVHCRALEQVVDELNAMIEDAERISNERAREERLAELRSPAVVADRLRWKFKPGFLEQADIESALRSRAARERFPDGVIAYRTWGWIYAYTHLPIDPRRLVLLYQSSTIKAAGVYFGTDKIAHFHDLGHLYFKQYLLERRRGADHDEAVRRVVRLFTRGPISESSTIGSWATGVKSNADLAANFAGMMFYMNLTEPVRHNGRELEPLLLFRNGRWRVNLHVRPESGYFGAYISDHWNEALNPSGYEWGVRKMVRLRMKQMAEDLIEFYADADGRPRDPAYFDALARELSTFDGVEYGHSGRFDNLLTLGNTCFPQLENGPDGRAYATDGPEPDSP